MAEADGEERVAIMRGVNVGLRDIGKPCMWFTAEVSESSGALQVLSWEQAADVLKAAKADNLADLEGWPCYVQEGGGYIKFLRPWSR